VTNTPSLLGKVLLLVENNTYPFDVRIRREAEALREAGYQVVVICPHKQGQPYHEISDEIIVYRFPYPPQGSGFLGYVVEFGYATSAMLVLSVWVWLRLGVDIIHAANPPDTLFVIGMMFRLLKKKFVFDQHDLSPETYLARFNKRKTDSLYRILRWLERCSYGTADIIIVTNQSYKKVAIERGDKTADEIYVVRNGPPLTYKSVLPDIELATKARYLIGYIGMMGPQDGVDYWLRAIHEMVFHFHRRDFLAVIIGSGDAVTGLHQLAHDLNIESYVWFTGYMSESDAIRYLSTMHICVQPDPLNPLNDNSTMIKMMEYMALGKPTVAFDLKETRFSARDSAMYARPNDIRDFAEKVIWLMNNPDARLAMGAFAKQRVTSKLAWEYSVPELVKAYLVLRTH
jgi:glycosyltransferase involved in cell wall biosynthesis